MTNSPTFFFSHARQDREISKNNLDRFFKDLEARLAQWSGVDLKAQKLGTLDTRTEHGENWDDTLSLALATNKTFIAIMTPIYFKRENCGKELTVFLLRSSGIGIDVNGSLTGVNNILPIKWLPERSYYNNLESEIPAIIRLIEDVPEEVLDDPERMKAIKRYRKKGMWKCVKVNRSYYDELIDAFVERIRSMADLPPANFRVSFATAHNAFELDWRKHVGGATAATPERQKSTPSIVPRAFDVAAFYITRRPLVRETNNVEFANFLIADTGEGADSAVSDLLADVRRAAVAEGLNAFHCATDPAVPDDAETVIDRLARLSERRVLTALVVDAAVWPRSDARVVEQIIASNRWVGPVLLAALDSQAAIIDVDQLVTVRGLPRRLVVLPPAGEARTAALRLTFVDAWGRILQASTGGAAGTERVPLLKGIHAPEPT